MSSDLRAPADTRMMGVVHDALRRDLTRLRRALAEAPPPRRRVALARHARWMMTFLREHHSGEDDALWPLLSQLAPIARPIVDQMSAQHAAVVPAITAVEEAADRCAAADDGREALLAALIRLEEVLLPHLRQEEDEAMPLVAAHMTQQQWDAVEQGRYLTPKSAATLAQEGHFLLDDLDPERSRLVTHLVPPAKRFVLLHGFGWLYRRAARARWGRPQLLPRQAEVHVDVAVPPDAVWDVLRDVTRVGEWSHECASAQWLGGKGEAVPGARFRGRNRQRWIRWGRTCEVLSVEPARELVWRTVPTVLNPDSTRWRVSLEPQSSGTRIVQRYDVTQAPPSVLEWTYARVLPAHRDRRGALQEDLRRLGEVAAAPQRPLPSPRPPDEASRRAARRVGSGGPR